MFTIIIFWGLISNSFWYICSDPDFPPYKWSYLARKWKDARYATPVCTVLYRHHERQVIWHLSDTGRMPLLSSLLSAQSTQLSLRRWTRKQDSCLWVPWPLSRAYYHLLHVSVGLESHPYPSDPVPAIGEKGGNPRWSCLLRGFNRSSDDEQEPDVISRQIKGAKKSWKWFLALQVCSCLKSNSKDSLSLIYYNYNYKKSYDWQICCFYCSYPIWVFCHLATEQSWLSK